MSKPRGTSIHMNLVPKASGRKRPASNVDPNTGFTCPKCEVGKTAVRDSRQDGDGYVVRRRECRACDYRFTTKEAPTSAIISNEDTAKLRLLKQILPKLLTLADEIDLLRAEHD